MLPFFREKFANASSIDHVAGSEAKRAVDEARASVAQLLSVKSEDVIFTSGSTEANNLALSVDVPVFTTPIEHPSVRDVLAYRKRAGDWTIPVDAAGLVLIPELLSRLQGESKACLVSIIATNNEIGTEQDIPMIGKIVNENGALLHLDGTQALGTRAIDMPRLGVSALSLSAHKISGPKGIGALVCNGKTRALMKPILHGGGHERGFRSGTLNVPAIVGLGAACRLLVSQQRENRERLTELRQRFLQSVRCGSDLDVVETIPCAASSPHILSIRIKGVNGRALLRAVKGTVAFSLGSACATNKAEPSHVLLALGLDKRAISETIRVSFAAEQSVAEIEEAAAHICAAAKSLLDYSLAT